MRLIKNDKLVPILELSRPLPAFYMTVNLTTKEKSDLIKAYDYIFHEEERRRRMAADFLRKSFQV